MPRRARAGSRSGRSQGTVRPLRTNETAGPLPGGAGGRVRRRAGAGATPGVSAGPAPKISVRIRDGSTPSADKSGGEVVHECRRTAQIRVARRRKAQLGEQRRPTAGRPSRSPRPAGRRLPGGCSRRVRRALGSWASRARLSSANGCSVPSRAPCSHHTSRVERSAARACSMASTGVAPTPARQQQHRRVTGAQGEAAPRGAPTSTRVADADVSVQIRAGRAVRLLLHADPVLRRTGPARQRVAAEERRPVRLAAAAAR